MKAYKFRLYPSRKQVVQLAVHLRLSKNLWNEMLCFVKGFYEEFGRFPTKKSLREFVKNSGLFSQVGQSLVDRLLNALWRKFELKGKVSKQGFPRFKSLDRMKSLYYPQFGFFLESKLEVTPFGRISIRKHRKIEGEIKTLVLKRESSGKWFAVFTVEEDCRKHRENFGEAVGVDLGLKTFAALSNGVEVCNPRHLEKHEEALACFQRRLSKKKRGSGNRRKAKLRVARLHEKVRNARRDFLHKVSKQWVDAYSVIALEKLSSRKMAEEKFGKQINDAGWNAFANMLRYKAEEAGCRVVFVNPENTTKTCSNCKSIQDMPLQERTYECPACGLVIDRDLNAARNILAKAANQLVRSEFERNTVRIRATAGTAESNASGPTSAQRTCGPQVAKRLVGDEAITSSMKEDATRFIGW